MGYDGQAEGVAGAEVVEPVEAAAVAVGVGEGCGEVGVWHGVRPHIGFRIHGSRFSVVGSGFAVQSVLPSPVTRHPSPVTCHLGGAEILLDAVPLSGCNV